ncbi:ATP-binding protein [Microbacterium excoecariae]|uniref:ATP-binding protein n=1 Tax=Microbacterium excoecariae TaxID=2715210 RepID=UPI00140B66B9|nr:PAS domain-containing sensor histidine kinase [Microbacterium excoecariae]
MNDGDERAGGARRAERSAGDRTRSVWRWQLVLAFSTVAIATVIALLDPLLFTGAPFIVGLALIVAITIATMAVPWHRVPRAGLAVIPFLDIVAIGFLSHSSDVRLGFLWVFPVAWIATYYSLAWLVSAICAIGVIVLVSALVVGFPTDQALRLFILTISLGFIGTTIQLGSARTRAAARLLRRQSGQLSRMLERAQHEEQRRTALLDTLQTGVAQVEPNGTIRASNAAYRRMYGLDAVPQLHPSRAVEYRDRRGDPVPAEETVIARAARGETFSGVRVWLFDVVGRWRVLEVSARYRIDGMIVVTEDVTAEAEAAHERRSLARVVSHELRSPLTAVLGHTDLLLERPDLPGSAREQLTVIESAAERMEEMIARILQDPGRDPAEDDTVVDVGEVVRASVAGFAPAAAAAGTALDLAARDGAAILGNGFRLRQAIDNLIGNAVKYTPRGGRVDVSVESDADAVVVTVSDTGIGIASDEIAHIYDPYFRANSARDSGIPGTGIGMGVVRDIVAQHGGRLDLHSVLARGTTATVTLPRRGAKELPE